MLVDAVRKPFRFVGFTSRALTAPVIGATACDGMEKLKGIVKYSAAAGPPMIEVSNDGISWFGTTALAADPALLPAGSGYAFDRDLTGWRFVRVTIPDAGATTVEANVETWPRR